MRTRKLVICCLAVTLTALQTPLAAEGFIAIAPDPLSGKGPSGSDTDSVDRDGAR
jgi:hypothetical protein